MIEGVGGACCYCAISYWYSSVHVVPHEGSVDVVYIPLQGWVWLQVVCTVTVLYRSVHIVPPEWSIHVYILLQWWIRLQTGCAITVCLIVLQCSYSTSWRICRCCLHFISMVWCTISVLYLMVLQYSYFTSWKMCPSLLSASRVSEGAGGGAPFQFYIPLA